MLRFTKLALTGVTALGLAMTPVSASANEDLAKVLAGLAILGITAKIIDDRNDRRRKSTSTVSRFDTIEGGRRVIDGDLRRLDRDRGVRSPRGARKTPLPDRCLRILDTSRGDRLVYGERCLNRNYAFANKLPDRCERLVRTDRGLRTVYGSRCLARDGWKVARR